MRIRCQLPGFVEPALNYIERVRWVLLGALASFTAIEVIVAAWLWRSDTPIVWTAQVTSLTGLTGLFCAFRRRRFLSWQAKRMVRTWREPLSIDTSAMIHEIVTFRAFVGMLLCWVLLSVLIYPYSRFVGMSSYFHGHFSDSDNSLFLALLQTHATLLGFFVVFLGFVFQLVSFRLAYETSLLPFLVRQARFGPIITVNLCFVLLNSVALIGKRAEHPTMPFRYLSVVGLLFAVLSALFLFRRTLELLGPEAVEDGLSALIRKELRIHIEEEQQQVVADHILEQECSHSGLRFSPIYFLDPMPVIRSHKLGKVVDIDLIALAKFARHLQGQIPLMNNPVCRAIVLRTLGDSLTGSSDALARVPPGEDTEENIQLLNQCFKIKEE
jgi:hypothetical protein